MLVILAIPDSVVPRKEWPLSGTHVLSRSRVSKQGLVDQIQPPCVFVSKIVLAHRYLIHLLSVGAFMLPWQS